MAEHIDWELEKENQEKKVVARSAKKKVTHRGCKLPSDYLTKKEKMMLNGEVVTMEMNKPVNYRIFKFWPRDIQKEYLSNLITTFGVGITEVMKMMGTTRPTFNSFLEARSLKYLFPKRIKPSLFDEENWGLFCKGEWKGYPYPFTRDTEQDELEETRNQALQNAPESRENALGATNSIAEGTDTSEEFDTVKGPIEAEKLQFTSMSFSIKDLKSWDDIFELLRKYPLPEHNRVSIELSERTCV